MNLTQLIASNKESLRRMDAMAPALCEWFDRELLAVHAQMPQDNGGLLMGAPVWGDAYIRRMLGYSMPTLSTDRNLAALAGKCWMVIYSPDSARPFIWEHTRWARINGIHTIWRSIPDELVKMAGDVPEARYGLLSACQNILAHMAGHAGMGLHMYMPDHLYEDGYFANLMRLRETHEAIVQLGVSVNAKKAAPRLEALRDASGCIPMTGVQLGDIALECIHARSGNLMLNGAKFPDELPDSQQWVWKGRDAIHVAGASQNIVYIAPHLCLDSPIAFTSTLDMLPPEYIPGDFYVPTPADGMSFFEMSDENRIPVQGYADMERFLYRAWSQVAFTDDYLPYLERRSLTPVTPNTDGMPDDEIDAQHQHMMLALRSGKQQAMEAYFNAQHPPRWEKAA